MFTGVPCVLIPVADMFHTLTIVPGMFIASANQQEILKNASTGMRFELTRAEPIGLAIFY
jgi:hypothetical protein